MNGSGFISARLLFFQPFSRLSSSDLPDRGKSHFVPAVPNRSFNKNRFSTIPASVPTQTVSIPVRSVGQAF